MAIDDFLKSDLTNKRISVAEYAPATLTTPPILIGSTRAPFRDVIARGLEDANLPYVVDFNPPSDTSKIWLDLNGTNFPDSKKASGVYKVFKGGAWVNATQADWGGVNAKNLALDPAKLMLDAQGRLTTVAGGNNITPNANGTFTLNAGRAYAFKVRCNFNSCLAINILGRTSSANLGLHQFDDGMGNVTYWDIYNGASNAIYEGIIYKIKETSGGMLNVTIPVTREVIKTDFPLDELSPGSPTVLPSNYNGDYTLGAVDQGGYVLRGVDYVQENTAAHLRPIIGLFYGEIIDLGAF